MKPPILYTNENFCRQYQRTSPVTGERAKSRNSEIKKAGKESITAIVLVLSLASSGSELTQ
jgi:hypothetical protein